MATDSMGPGLADTPCVGSGNHRRSLRDDQNTTDERRNTKKIAVGFSCVNATAQATVFSHAIPRLRQRSMTLVSSSKDTPFCPSLTGKRQRSTWSGRDFLVVGSGQTGGDLEPLDKFFQYSWPMHSFPKPSRKHNSATLYGVILA